MSFANLGEHGAHRETTHFLNRTIDDRKPLDRRISTVAYAQPSKRNLYFFPFLFYFLSFFLFSLFSIRHPRSIYNIYIYIYSLQQIIITIPSSLHANLYITQYRISYSLLRTQRPTPIVKSPLLSLFRPFPVTDRGTPRETRPIITKNRGEETSVPLRVSAERSARDRRALTVIASLDLRPDGFRRFAGR